MYFIEVFCAILCLLILTRAKMLDHGKIVACQIKTQSELLEEGITDFEMNEMEWSTLCTHLIILEYCIDYKMPPNNKTIEDFMQITGLKRKHPRLKISSTAVAYDIFEKYIESRSRDADDFFTNYVEFLINHNFDGVDVSFGYFQQTLIEIEKMSKQSGEFFEFLRRLKHALNDRNLFITSSFSASLDSTSMKLNVLEYVNNFELFHFLQLSRHTDETKDTFGHVLNEMKLSNVKQKIRNLIKIWKIPASKIVLSTVLGGPVVVTELNKNIMEAKYPGFVPYNNACKLLASNRTLEIMIDEEYQMIHLIVKNKDYKEVGTLPMTRTIHCYMKEIVVENNLAGAMAIFVNDDDYNGICKLKDDNSDGIDIPKRPDSKFPFIRTIHEALYLGVKAAKGNASSCPTNLFWAVFVLLTIFLT